MIAEYELVIHTFLKLCLSDRGNGVTYSYVSLNFQWSRRTVDSTLAFQVRNARCDSGRDYHF
jgi:hypothetical protein